MPIDPIHRLNRYWNEYRRNCGCADRYPHVEKSLFERIKKYKNE